MTAAVDTSTLRRRGLIWLSVLVALAVAAGVVWATGGFESGARPYLGPEHEVGDVVETRFWDIAVNGAVIDEKNMSVDLDVDVINKTKSSSILNPTVLMIRLGDGEVMYRSHCVIGSRGTFAPLISTSANCRFEYDQNELPDPDPGNDDITVLVLDQAISDDILMGESIVPDVIAGHVELVATWQPLEEEQ